MSLDRLAWPRPRAFLAGTALVAVLLGEPHSIGISGSGAQAVFAQGASAQPSAGARSSVSKGAGQTTPGSKSAAPAVERPSKSGAAGQASPAPAKTGGGSAARTAPPAKRRPPAGEPVDDDPRADRDDSDESANDEDDSPAEEPTPGSAEWLIREAARLRIEPVPEGTPAAEAARLIAARQQKVIDLTQKAIALVHKDPQKQLVLGAAARYLLEARLELAIAGDEEQADLLVDEARAFYQRDPRSDAAAAGALCLARYSHAQAVHATKDQADWRIEFTRHARHLLDRFPKQRAQAVLLTHTAGRLAEEHGQLPEALACFDAVSEVAPETPQGEESAALARRLRLPGNPPRITGQTLAGAEFDLDDLLGQPVLVVFWATTSKPFLESWTEARPVVEAAQQQGLQVVGVCLDTDARTATQGARKLGLDCPLLFSGDPEQAGWNNPIARHYAVFELPTYWLIDSNGNVATTRLTTRELRKKIAEQLGSRRVEQAGAEVDGTANPEEARPTRGDRKPASGAGTASGAPKSSANPARKPNRSGPASGD